jgi:hypothetical protein
MNSLVHLMHGDCWTRWDSVIRTYAPPPDHLVLEAGGSDTLLMVAIKGYVLVHGEDRGGECHESLDLRTSTGGSSLCSDENLLGVSSFVAAVCSWGRQHR